MWTRTGFADEIADDLAEQIALLTELGVKYVEFRSAWGINVLKLDDEQLARAKQMLDEAGIKVSSVGSPIGKIFVTDDFEPHLADMDRALHVAQYLGAPNIRIFSFFIPEGDDPDQHRDEVLRRMRALVDRAAGADVVLLHENEKDIYGDVPSRVKGLADALACDHFKLIIDPANYVQCDARPFDEAWPLLRDRIAYVHVKDAVAGTPTIVPAGDGDGQWRELIAALKESGYDGFFSIEPHLADYTAFGAMTGPTLWAKAHDALVGLFDEVGVEYA
ncbi:sugar phosphate isomerase/epimerase family protein [Aestuariimicrobium ganziense]|uniref:sugar phosphate isomerase/epimerase family protein n=1 Tax=Aestuariimicrobium ganziense TaxID=2773677 RepID=UPI001940BABE|nr:sugar phosphate isomerase/epimerase family protein [Aestuariimicrobium ganziense]